MIHFIDFKEKNKEEYSLILNFEEIETVRRGTGDFFEDEGCTIIMKSGKTYEVQSSYDRLYNQFHVTSKEILQARDEWIDF